MGNNNSSGGSVTSSRPSISQRDSTPRREPLRFHRVHSEHIELYNGERVARRVESFCKGICFSARPIAVGESVSIRCSDISTNWSGFLRVGFTSNNPSSLDAATLPRYACPDMTNLPGNWAKALPERFGIVNNVITYVVNRSGDVHISLNNEDLPGPFFSGVNVSSPLWALIDIYGNATGVEFLDKTTSPLVFVSTATDGAVASRKRRTGSSPMSPGTTAPVTTPVKHHSKYSFNKLMFHRITGHHVGINSERNVAVRHSAEYANAFVFTERPINPGEKIVIQVLGIDASYTGGLTLGVTSCDPSSLSREDFPDDSDKLLDRPEYWIVHKDVISSAEVGDELSLFISNDGEVKFSRNSNAAVTILHVDKTIPIWIFWDLYGQFSQIKLLGIAVPSKPKSRASAHPLPVSDRPLLQLRSNSLPDAPQSAHSPAAAASLTVALPPIKDLSLAGAPPVPPRLQRAATSYDGFSANAVSSPVSLSSPSQDIDESSQNMANECTVCFENVCDSVVYTCGHMCMCYNCAVQVKASADPLCPICRQDIKDVIRIFKS